MFTAKTSEHHYSKMALQGAPYWQVTGPQMSNVSNRWTYFMKTDGLLEDSSMPK